MFPGFFDDLKLRSALAELRRATGGRLSRAARGFDGLSLAADAATAKDATGRTEQISNSETLDITGFRAMADFFVSAINYFFFLVTAQSLPRTLI